MSEKWRFVGNVNLYYRSAYYADIVLDLLLGREKPVADYYEPQPGTKWFWQEKPESRSIHEPPPSDNIILELGLYQSGEGSWPSWYIGWDYENGTWDWAGGWQRHGLSPPQRTQPYAEGLRWYWQDDASGRFPDEPRPTDMMLAEEDAYR